MACYHPIQAYNIAPSTADKMDLVFSEVQASSLSKTGVYRSLHIPCGHCVGCRLDYSRQWANRCMLELGYHDSSYFCTFTYDDAHLPVSYSSNPDTGEIVAPVATLDKTHPQLLLKKIRNHYKTKVRYFGCAEYGTQSLRPHYHLILFGLSLPDLETHGRAPTGEFYYTSPSLSSCWSDTAGDSRGHVLVAQVTWETCAYVARYALKKQGNDRSDYEQLGIVPEYPMMSRRPGIGRQYLDDHPDLWYYNYINLPGGRKVPPPRYYKRILRDNDDLSYKDLSYRNMLAYTSKFNLKKGLTDLDYYGILKAEEESKVKRIKALRRNII